MRARKCRSTSCWLCVVLWLCLSSSFDELQPGRRHAVRAAHPFGKEPLDGRHHHQKRRACTRAKSFHRVRTARLDGEADDRQRTCRDRSQDRETARAAPRQGRTRPRSCCGGRAERTACAREEKARNREVGLREIAPQKSGTISAVYGIF